MNFEPASWIVSGLSANFNQAEVLVGPPYTYFVCEASSRLSAAICLGRLDVINNAWGIRLLLLSCRSSKVVENLKIG